MNLTCDSQPGPTVGYIRTPASAEVTSVARGPVDVGESRNARWTGEIMGVDGRGARDARRLMAMPSATTAKLAGAGVTPPVMPRATAKLAGAGATPSAMARGRVQRLGRGVYCYRRAPVSTARRIGIFAEACRDWLVATTRTAPPKQTPGDQPNPAPTEVPGSTEPEVGAETRVQAESSPGDGPGPPPWAHLGWLWTT